MFLFVHQRFASHLRNALHEFRFEAQTYLTFGNSFVFDLLIMHFVWRMDQKELQQIFLSDSDLTKSMQDFVKWMRTHKYYHNFQWNPKSFAELLGKIPFGNTQLEVIESDLVRQPQSMKGFFLKDFIGFDSNLLYYGQSGSGISCNLFFLSAWAYYNEVVQIKIPSSYVITQELEIDYPVYHYETKLYL